MNRSVPRRALIGMLAGAGLISTNSIFVRYAHVATGVSTFYRTVLDWLGVGISLFGIFIGSMRDGRPWSRTESAVEPA